MAFDFGELVSPAHTAVVTCEMQRGIIGDLTSGPELAAEAADLGILAKSAELCRSARAHGVRVVHAMVELRGDRAGLSINNPMMAYVVKNPDQVRQGSPAADLCPELGPEPEDIVSRRIHGLTPFTGTELDAVIRNLGVRTIVLMGVSLNLGIMGAALSALDLGYQVVIVRDAVVGLPKEYAEAVLQNSLSMIATIVTADELVAAWS